MHTRRTQYEYTEIETMNILIDIIRTNFFKRLCNLFCVNFCTQVSLTTLTGGGNSHNGEVLRFPLLLFVVTHSDNSNVQVDMMWSGPLPTTTEKTEERRDVRCFVVVSVVGDEPPKRTTRAGTPQLRLKKRRKTTCMLYYCSSSIVCLSHSTTHKEAQGRASASGRRFPRGGI